MKKFTKYILQIITGVGATVTLCAGKVMALTVQEGADAAKSTDMPTELVGTNGIFTRVSNTVLYAVGIISVFMLVWGGVRYIISGGDSKKITDAKNTILYAIIGLIIALLAYAIVNFVLKSLGSFSADNAAEQQAFLYLSSIFG